MKKYIAIAALAVLILGVGVLGFSTFRGHGHKVTAQPTNGDVTLAFLSWAGRALAPDRAVSALCAGVIPVASRSGTGIVAARPGQHTTSYQCVLLVEQTSTGHQACIVVTKMTYMPGADPSNVTARPYPRMQCKNIAGYTGK